FVLVTIDQSGKTEETKAQTVKTEGYTVTVSVLGKNDEPIKNQDVTLHSEPMNAKTDDSGMVTFEDVSPGLHKLEYEQDGEKYSQDIEVLDNVVITSASETAAPQTFAVVYDTVDATPLPVGVILSLVLVLAVLGGGFVLYRSGKLTAITDRFNRRGPGGTPGEGPTGIVLGGHDGGSAKPSSELDDNLNKIPGQKPVDPGSVISPDGGDKKSD
ncbi:MAG: hypothetical protein ACRD4B_07275, partial [Acidobacteriota bacterium]